MTYALALGAARHFSYSVDTLNALHFMVAEVDTSKHPGRLRDHQVFVPIGDGESYTPPPADDVPVLMNALVDRLNHPTGSPIVEAAMAHLNLVGIHGYEDGNGRLSRVLHSLVLARAGLPPELCSIEEFIGRNTTAFYAALAAVDGGDWSPQNDATPWIRFYLEAHWRQANATSTRFVEAALIYDKLTELIVEHALPGRSLNALYVATIGNTLTNRSYRAETDLDDPQTASRDLNRLANSGVFVKEGDRRGAEYTAGPPLQALRRDMRAKRPSIPPLYDTK